MDATLRGRWFDGRSGQARPVLLRMAANARGRATLRLHPLEATGADPLHLDAGQFTWPDTWEPSSTIPYLTVDLGPHGGLEVDGRAWHQALEACGARLGLAQRLQRRWPVLLGAVAAAALVVWAFSRWGTPWVAAQLARAVPEAWEREISHKALDKLERKGLLKPSRIPQARQRELQTQFALLNGKTPDSLRPSRAYAPTMDLQFRSGMGPNAFALPGGVMVMTDAMVELAGRQERGDEALMGVLAHEAGHVLHRHGTRRLIELGVLNAGAALVLGDVSGLVATSGTVLATLAYSRDHEREADCYAIATMQANGQPLAPMAELLVAADKAHGSARYASGPVFEWLRTHPETAGRASGLKAGGAEYCPRS